MCVSVCELRVCVFLSVCERDECCVWYIGGDLDRGVCSVPPPALVCTGVSPQVCHLLCQNGH